MTNWTNFILFSNLFRHNRLHCSNDAFDIVICHPKEHGQRNDLLISGFSLRKQSRSSVKFVSVKRLQVYGYIVNVYADALFSQFGKKCCSIGAKSFEIDFDHIEVVGMK